MCIVHALHRATATDTDADADAACFSSCVCLRLHISFFSSSFYVVVGQVAMLRIFFGCFCFIFSHTDHFSFHFISGCRVCTRCARSHFSRTVPLSARHTLSVDQVHSFNFIHLHLLQFLVSFMLIRDVFYILLLRSNIAFFCALIWLAPRSFIIGILFGALCCFIVNIMLPFKPHFPFVSVC